VLNDVVPFAFLFIFKCALCFLNELMKFMKGKG